MASISLSVSTENESNIHVTPLEREGDCLSINLSMNLNVCGEHYVHSRDWVTIHGSIADIRLLAERMLAALPQKSAEPDAAMIAEVV